MPPVKRVVGVGAAELVGLLVTEGEVGGLVLLLVGLSAAPELVVLEEVAVQLGLGVCVGTGVPLGTAELLLEGDAEMLGVG